MLCLTDSLLFKQVNDTLAVLLSSGIAIFLLYKIECSLLALFEVDICLLDCEVRETVIKAKGFRDDMLFVETSAEYQLLQIYQRIAIQSFVTVAGEFIV